MLTNTRFSNTVSLSTNIKGGCLPSPLSIIFLLKKYFSPSFRDLSLKKKLGDLKVFPCIMNKDVPNFVHTFSFVALDFKNVVLSVAAKTYILLQVIPQIAPVVL